MRVSAFVMLYQVLRLVVRWLPDREITFVADRSFAALELLDKVKTLHRSNVITLTAQLLIEMGATCVRSTAWYRKTHPTFRL